MLFSSQDSQNLHLSDTSRSATLSHSVSSAYTDSSYAYTEVLDGEELERLRRVICLKTFAIVFTMLGGAILALCINVWQYKHGLTSETGNEETDGIGGTGGGTGTLKDKQGQKVPEKFFDGITFFQIKNINRDICIAHDALKDNKWDFSGWSSNTFVQAYSKKCDMSPRPYNQMFNYNKDTKHISMGQYCFEMCLMTKTVSKIEYYRALIMPCKVGERSQMWYYENNEIYALDKNGQRHCLTSKWDVETNKGALCLDLCSKEDPIHSHWEFVKRTDVHVYEKTRSSADSNHNNKTEHHKNDSS